MATIQFSPLCPSDKENDFAHCTLCALVGSALDRAIHSARRRLPLGCAHPTGARRLSNARAAATQSSVRHRGGNGVRQMAFRRKFSLSTFARSATSELNVCSLVPTWLTTKHCLLPRSLTFSSGAAALSPLYSGLSDVILTPTFARCVPCSLCRRSRFQFGRVRCFVPERNRPHIDCAACS